MILRPHRFAIAALAAVAFLSCNKVEPEVDEGQKPGMLKLSLFSQRPSYGQQSTRTHWNGSTILWSSDDRVSLCVEDDSLWHDEIYESDAVKEDASKAIFDFSVPSTLEGHLRFHTIYPSSAVNGFAEAAKVSVTIPAVQYPSASSFDPKADLMSGVADEEFNGVPEGKVHVVWNRLVAHADFRLLNLPFDESEEVRSVTFKVQDGAALTGNCLLDMSGHTLEPSSTDAGNEVMLIADGLQRASDGTMRVWAAFMPVTATSLEVTLETDKAVYTRTMQSCSMKFIGNSRNYFTVDMSVALKEMLPGEEQRLNALVDSRVFEMLDLDHPGMAKVKSLYSDGRLYMAAQALLEYWRTGRTVVNPDIDLASANYSAAEKEKADKALKENGYCFFVKNYDFNSFADGKGGINWGFTLPNETQFNIQKHRHQWVLPQAKVYWGTKDENYVRSYMEVYSSWLDAHPCPVLSSGTYTRPSSHSLRDMWTDLQATSRVMEQISVLDYYITSESFTPEFLTRFLAAYADAVECIRANPYFEQLSNHRLYEIQAVFTAAVMMPEFKNSSAWLDEASDDIVAQSKVQFADDGVLVEMDPSYHISMVAIFYDTHRIAAANGKTEYFPSDYRTSLQKAVKFVRDLAYPDYGIEDFNDVRSSSWTKSTLTKNFLKYHDMFPEDKTLQYWATGHAQGEAPTELLSLYKTTGWYMLRDGWTKNSSMMILKNNYNLRKDGGIWWHCQPDNCTVSLYHKGRRFLPDAGSYTYTNGADRDAFRATSMHNTLTLNGATIADDKMRGEFRNSVQTDKYDMVHVSNQSYGALRHERALFRVKDGFYVVVDFAIGSATGSVELNWHFCPGTITFTKESGSYTAKTNFSDGNNMMFKMFSFEGTSAASSFSSKQDYSYTSHTIGQREKRSCCRVSVQKTEGQTPVRFITVIHPFGTASDIPNISAKFDSASRITVTIGGKTYSLAL